MDMSLVEVDDKQVNVNEVPEYAAEIHSYLREMEVRLSFSFLPLLSSLLQQSGICFR